MNATEKIKLVSFFIATLGLTWALAELGFFSQAVLKQYPQLTFAYILLYVGIVGIFVSMLWKK